MSITDLLQPIKDRLNEANNGPFEWVGSNLEGCPQAPTDQARLIAAIEEVEDWCKNLDAVELANPGVLNARADAVSTVLRKVITLALESAA